jgi:hypothetical protein
MGLTAALGLLVTLLLIGLLVAKQLMGAAPGDRVVQWRRTINVGIMPLLLSFVVIAAVKIAALA